jgi:hypothetical protein
MICGKVTIELNPKIQQKLSVPKQLPMRNVLSQVKKVKV